MISIIINKTISTPQHKAAGSESFEAVLALEVVVDPVVKDPVSLKLLEKFEVLNFLPQFPQNSATSLFSWPQFGHIFDIFYPL